MPQVSNMHILKKLRSRTTKIATSNDRNGITSKKPGTVLSMQNVDGARSNREPLGQRKGMIIHKGGITHEI